MASLGDHKLSLGEEIESCRQEVDVVYVVCVSICIVRKKFNLHNVAVLVTTKRVGVSWYSMFVKGWWSTNLMQ